MYQPFMYTAGNTSPSILGLLSKIKWSSILSGTQKVLNLANQAIPLYYNVKPIVNNLKTISKIGKQLNNNDNSDIKTTNNSKNNQNTYQDIPKPSFFI